MVASAQFNVDRVIMSGRAALYYEDYVLSIQYFNQALNLKPFLWEPWQLRGVAKLSLEDYQGAETDATQSLLLNPYIPQTYDLRAISRIRQKNFEGAIADYTEAIHHDPTRKEFWHNRAICRMELKDYAQASADIDTIMRRWEKYMPSYMLKTEVMLRQKDTLEASKWIDRTLDIDPYNADAWRVRGYITLSQQEWKKADEAFSKVIHFRPKASDCYLNRAVARLKLNNLRGAMQDYDYALEFDPTNFLGHYNRGLLRQQVGDDNRAIEDFNFVLSLEPDNMMALFNRATLLDRTGDLKAAIRDYSKVIDEFPNFWTGLHYRAGCYRRLGMINKAEMDEFRILKAQMDKHLGKQPRWTRKKLSEIRKKSDVDPEKYNQIVVDDENETKQEYKSDYRGRVQNRHVASALQPFVVVSLQAYQNVTNSHKPYSRELDGVNLMLAKITSGEKNPVVRELHLNVLPGEQHEDSLRNTFARIDSITARIQSTTDPEQSKCWILARCAAYTAVQNYQDATADADMYLAVDSTSALAWCQRAVCNARINEFDNNNLRAVGILSDFDRAHRLASDNAYVLYCRGTFHAQRNEYSLAIEYLSKAIALDPQLPEAYYNRGITYLRYGDKEHAITDLGKAGELGLYQAYSIIKANRK